MERGFLPERLRRVSLILGALLAGLAAQAPVVSAPAEPPLEYIVVLKHGAPSEPVDVMAHRVVASAGKLMPSLRLRRRETRTAAGRKAWEDLLFRHALRGFAVRFGAEDSDRLDALRGHPDVAFVAVDRRVELHGQIFQPGMERIRARRVGLAGINDIDDGNLDVDIAILDTGIDATHPDLNVYQSVSFVSGDSNPGDPHGHGTHVAGIAAAIDDAAGVHGVAPGARLWSVRVVDVFGNALTSDVIAGLDYVAAHAVEIDVANMSLGTPSFGDDGNCGATSGDPLHQAICGVVDSGVVVVVSAGNFVPFGRDASLVSPASFDEVITVSAVIETDGVGPGAGEGLATQWGADNSFARTFSNYGWDVDIAAPGVDVISTWPGGGYSVESGTSMAAPHVSGAAAVWIVKNGKPGNRLEVLHVRDELVRLGFPRFGADEGFSGDKETFAEPLLNVAPIDPVLFDPVEPELNTDKSVYEYGVDVEAVITVHVKNQQGLPLTGLPSSGFSAMLHGREQLFRFESLGQGDYSLALEIDDVLPGDHDFTALIRDASGFERSAGCRIVIRDASPRIRIHDYSFFWPVMNQDSFFDSNPLRAALMDEKGAPLVISPESFATLFSGGGPPLAWFYPAPDFITGVFDGITYGAYQTEVSSVQTLPLGTYHADLTVVHAGMSDARTASFDIGYYDPDLTAELAANQNDFDFSRQSPPPALNLRIDLLSEWSTGVPDLLETLVDPLILRIDGQPWPGVGFTEDPRSPGTYFAHDVDLEAVGHGTHELVVHVTDQRGLQADSNPVAIQVIREVQSCSNPLAAVGQTDTDGDGFRDECDNCPTTSNPSQRNTSFGSASEADLGDACKARATLRVSSDVADNPDFFTIQEAVDQALVTPLGVQIEILPGTGPYTGNVVVDRGQSFGFVGRDFGAGPPVVEYDGAGGGVFDLRSAGPGPIVIRHLVLRGLGIAANQRGIVVAAPMSTVLSDLSFERLGDGVELQAGDHLVERITMDATVGTGVQVGEASLSLSYGEFRGLGQGVRILGSTAQVELEQLLIVGGGAGEGIMTVSASASLELRHSTLVDCGTAVGGSGGNTAIAHSVLWNNQSDLSGVSCADIDWSDVEDVNCGGTNRSADPLFVDPIAGNYRLQATSPLLDHGPEPGGYDGAPCLDLDGGLRLRDHDGDGLARLDPGAYERENSALTSRAVDGLVWTAPTALQWSATPGAIEYHIYRAPLSTLAYSAFGTCEDGIDAVRSDTSLDDPSIPPVGEGYYYEITLEDAAGEQTLGGGSCAERSNFIACP